MPKQREKMTEVHSCGSPPFSTCLGAVASFIISQGQKCHKKPFPLGSLKDEVKENTVQEVRKALQANIEAIQRATKLLEKQSDTLTSVMKQKIRELEESKNSFFRYEGLKLYLFWGGMVCNILVFLMLLYGMLGK